MAAARQRSGCCIFIDAPLRLTASSCFNDAMPLLELSNLSVEFPGSPRPVAAVRDVSFSIEKGEVLGLVGESGSGKSVTSLAIMRLLPPQARVTGHIKFEDRD